MTIPTKDDPKSLKKQQSKSKSTSYENLPPPDKSKYASFTPNTSSHRGKENYQHPKGVSAEVVQQQSSKQNPSQVNYGKLTTERSNKPSPAQSMMSTKRTSITPPSSKADSARKAQIKKTKILCVAGAVAMTALIVSVTFVALIATGKLNFDKKTTETKVDHEISAEERLMTIHNRLDNKTNFMNEITALLNTTPKLAEENRPLFALKNLCEYFRDAGKKPKKFYKPVKKMYSIQQETLEKLKTSRFGYSSNAGGFENNYKRIIELFQKVQCNVSFQEKAATADWASFHQLIDMEMQKRFQILANSLQTTIEKLKAELKKQNVRLRKKSKKFKSKKSKSKKKDIKKNHSLEKSKKVITFFNKSISYFHSMQEFVSAIQKHSPKKKSKPQEVTNINMSLITCMRVKDTNKREKCFDALSVRTIVHWIWYRETTLRLKMVANRLVMGAFKILAGINKNQTAFKTVNSTNMCDEVEEFSISVLHKELEIGVNNTRHKHDTDTKPEDFALTELGKSVTDFGIEKPHQCSG